MWFIFYTEYDENYFILFLYFILNRIWNLVFGSVDSLPQYHLPVTRHPAIFIKMIVRKPWLKLGTHEAEYPHAATVYNRNGKQPATKHWI